ncbi:hypothetical protein ACWDSJ_14235 [Nocardia sp. NPDC003482]
MSKTGRYNYRRPRKGRNRPDRAQHHITVRGVRKEPPDYYQLSRAVIAMELEEMGLSKPQVSDVADLLKGLDGQRPGNTRRPADTGQPSPTTPPSTDHEDEEAKHDSE